MESILISIVSLALIVFSTVTMTFSTLQAANRLSDAWKVMVTQSRSMARTEISSTPPGAYSGGPVYLSIENRGQVNLADFPRWDFIVQYRSGESLYLTYSPAYPPAAGQWALEGIYITGGRPEVFDPDILNPGELMAVALNVSPEIALDETVRIIAGTPNGVTAQRYLTRG